MAGCACGAGAAEHRPDGAVEVRPHHAVDDGVLSAVRVAERQRERQRHDAGRVCVQVRVEVVVEHQDVVGHPGDGEQDGDHQQHLGDTAPGRLHPSGLPAIARPRLPVARPPPAQQLVGGQQLLRGRHVRQRDGAARDDVDEEEKDDVERLTVPRRRPMLVAKVQLAAVGQRVRRDFADDRQGEHDGGGEEPDGDDGRLHAGRRRQAAGLHRVADGEEAVEAERHDCQHTRRY